VFKSREVVLPWLLLTALPKLQGTVCPCVNWTQLFPTLSFSFLCSFVSHSNSTPGYCTTVGNLLGHLARVQLEPFVVVSLQSFAFCYGCSYFRWHLLFLLRTVSVLMLWQENFMLLTKYRKTRKLISTPAGLISLTSRSFQEKRVLASHFLHRFLL